MKKLTFCFASFAFLAFGQKAETVKMDRHATAQAWATVNFPLPSDTPSISGGGLITESEINGFGRKVWLTTTQPGTYLLQGKNCNGDEVKLGELGWGDQIGSNLIYDSSALSGALPFFLQLCSVEVVRLDKGKIERLAVEVNPWQASTPGPQFGSEGVMKGDGRYFVALPSLPADATVIVGRLLIATEIQRSPTSNIVMFPAGAGLPPLGPTTLTVCSKGHCSTTTFERKVGAPGSGGKG